MAGNTFGRIFQITTFGESHGEMIGVVIDGCPAGLELDMEFIQREMDRRRPGQSKITTQRKEADRVRLVSGVLGGKSTGAPIAALIPNEDQRSKDYDHLADAFRPSHADFTYERKYGLRDVRGGGRSSARETAARVAAGAIAKLLLRRFGVEIRAYVSQVGGIRLETAPDLKQVESNIVRCPDADTARRMIELIDEVRKQGDTIGGVVSCLVQGCPAGLGEPVFDRLHADLGKAMLSINAVKGFEIGSGFAGVEKRGSEHNDPFVSEGGKIRTTKNDSGGIQGGISNGMPIEFRVAFKPVSTLMKPQTTQNREQQPVTLEGKGRHDPCVVPRAVPIVEAMAALTLADHLLRDRAARVAPEGAGG
jgi:chorismate synthase